MQTGFGGRHPLGQKLTSVLGFYYLLNCFRLNQFTIYIKMPEQTQESFPPIPPLPLFILQPFMLQHNPTIVCEADP